MIKKAVGEGVDKSKHTSLAQCDTTVEQSWVFSQKRDHRGAVGLIHPLPGVCPGETEMCTRNLAHGCPEHPSSCGQVETTQYPPGNKREDKMWARPAPRPATRRKGLLTHAATWTDAENLPESSQTPGNREPAPSRHTNVQERLQAATQVAQGWGGQRRPVGTGLSFRGDQNLIESDCGDGCTIKDTKTC